MVDRVAVFVRAPVAGAVKSRLARSIGTQQALIAHETLALHVLNNLTATSDFELEIWSSQPHPQIARWSTQFNVPARSQVAGDLGARMLDGLTRLCAEGGKGIIVGSDCPSIDVSYIHLALSALNDAEVVLGPAEDGGYGLIGVSRLPVPDVFTGVAWGTSEVLKQTLELAASSKLHASLLPTIWDVDEMEDWQRFQDNY